MMVAEQDAGGRAGGRLAELVGGVKAEAPILLGVVPFGMVYGVLAMRAGLGAHVAQGMSSVLFAGSAQVIAVQLVGAGVPAAMLVVTIAIVNLRHALYSASVAPYVQALSVPWKLVLAYLLTDEAYAVTVRHYQEEPKSGFRHWFFLGAGFTLWSGWQLSTAAGVILGAQLPKAWSLDFALPLTFIALLVPAIKDRPGAAAAAAAGIVAVLAFGLPLKLGFLAAAFAGIIVGMLTDWMIKSRSS
jgi:4-azaleucine resistance transporter AzlC